MSDWSYGPTASTKPKNAAIAPPVLAVLILALLVAGVVGVAIHHQAAAAAAVATTPVGFQRVPDPADHLSVAIPPGWQVAQATTGSMSAALQRLKAASPQLSALADVGLATLSKVQVGVFAADAATRTILATYGAPDPGLTSIKQLSSSQLSAQLSGLGAKSVAVANVHLPLGPAKRVSVQLLVGTVTVSELLDVLVLDSRVVVILMAARGDQAPVATLQQIEATLTPA